MITIAQITCPHCHQTFDLGMSPYDQLAQIPCPFCGQTVTRNPDDHCVVCSHGNVVCLSRQARRDCCSG